MKSDKNRKRTYLIDLLGRFRKQISVALGLVILENVAWIVEPALFGKVIDTLIDKAGNLMALISWRDAMPLLVWIFAFAVNSGTGVVRRIVDQKIYLEMFTDLATEIATAGAQKKQRASKTAALAQLSEQYITFFEYRVPEILEQIISIGGAVVALWAFDSRIALTCLTIVGPLLLINRVYTKKVGDLQRQYHDLFENTYDVFSTQEPPKVRAYFNESARAKQRIANWGALNFGVMRLFLLAIFLVVLYIAIDLDDFSTGSIYAIVAYIWTFITSSEYLPELMESWASLKDVSRRLQSESV